MADRGTLASWVSVVAVKEIKVSVTLAADQFVRSLLHTT